MNALVRPSSADVTPHRFTVEEMWALTGSGALGDDAQVELIEGELIDMPDDGALHIDWSSALGRWLHTSLDERFVIVPGSTLRLSDISGPKPDWYVFAATLRTEDVRGEDVLLAIEQSKTSLRFDLGRKADLYASYGVRDYWAIDLVARGLHQFRDPGDSGYAQHVELSAETAVSALLIPDLTLRIADLPRVG